MRRYLQIVLLLIFIILEGSGRQGWTIWKQDSNYVSMKSLGIGLNQSRHEGQNKVVFKLGSSSSYVTTVNSCPLAPWVLSGTGRVPENNTVLSNHKARQRSCFGKQKAEKKQHNENITIKKKRAVLGYGSLILCSTPAFTTNLPKYWIQICHSTCNSK